LDGHFTEQNEKVNSVHGTVLTQIKQYFIM
jgi:hypothetical protein